MTQYNIRNRSEIGNYEKGIKIWNIIKTENWGKQQNNIVLQQLCIFPAISNLALYFKQLVSRIQLQSQRRSIIKCLKFTEYIFNGIYANTFSWFLQK